MKLSLITSTLIIGLALTACGKDDVGTKTNEPPGNDPPPPPSSSAPTRQLIEGSVLPTSPVNLLADPGFGLVGGEASYGSFLAFYENLSTRVELTSTLDSRSPAGFGGGVAVVRPDGATDTKSEPIVMLTSFLGGTGPFHAQVWVSKSDVDDKPIELPTEKDSIAISVTDGDPGGGDAYDLSPVEGATRTAGKRTWTLFRADIGKSLDGGSFFYVRIGDKGGHIELAAPEVTSEKLAVGQPVMRRGAFASPRVKSPAELAAIRKYRTIKPRLTPAQPKVRRGE